MELSEWHMWWKRQGARELRNLLMTSWDPIGVQEAPEAWNEYDGYMSPIVALLQRDGSSVEDLARYLSQIRVKWMDCGPNEAVDLEAASSIYTWYQEAMGS